MSVQSGDQLRWLTRREAAERLRVHPATIDRMARSGQLPRYGHGQRLVRFKQEDVDGLLERVG